MQLSRIIEDLLINLLFVLVVLFCLHLWNDRKFRTSKEVRVMVTLFSALGIIFCITFSIHISEGYLFDLRQIPFLLGGLYGGYVAMVILFLVTMLYRIAIGGAGVYSTLIILASQMAILCILIPRFSAMSTTKKIITAVGLSVFTSCAVLGALITMSGNIEFTFEVWLAYFLIPGCGIGFVTYAAEMMRKHTILQAEVVRAEKLSIVSHLAASISHEVRNPLTVVRGMLQLIEHDDFPSDKKKKFVRTSIVELDRAEAIIRDYLTFAKAAPVGIASLTIQDELEHVMTIIEPMANMNQVEIHTSFEEGPFMIQGDRQKVQQCFLNIMKNSIEAMMPNGGTLTVTVTRQRHTVQISVQDTGAGMTSAQIARLGEPYFSTKSNGTGLGMVVVFSVIESMGGTIHIASKIGKGTQFVIDFPLLNMEAGRKL